MVISCIVLSLLAPLAAPSAPPKPLSTSELLAQSSPTDWRPLDPSNTIVLELPGGQVVFELAPLFAPRHSANVRTLVREHYFDGLSVLRSQDNYVVQWGDPDDDDPKKAKSLGTAARSLPAEFSRPSGGLSFNALPDADTYAPEVGFVGGFPAARDPKTNETWLAHCYGTVGAGRDMAKDSSNGSELYVVIGQSPRHLDRNITVIGRVISGMEVLSTLHRGSGMLGFYEKPEERVPIARAQLLADIPADQRPAFEVLRTETPFFRRYVDARRNRRDPWFVDPVGHVELCNVGVPVRPRGKTVP